MEAALAMPVSPHSSAAWRKGRLVGALICGFFGAVWMFDALYFGNIATPGWLAVLVVCTVFFIAWPVTRIWTSPRAARTHADRQRWKSLARAYWSIVAIEWLLSAAAVIWLVHIHRFSLMPQALGIIIGVHFLPLAKLFKMPIYFGTGIVMMLGVLASLAIAPGPLRNIAACSADGLTLWATAVVILCRKWHSSHIEGEPQ
jgi:hypothetical protein